MGERVYDEEPPPFSCDFLADYLAPTGTRQLTRELAVIFDFEKNLTKLRETNISN